MSDQGGQSIQVEDCLDLLGYKRDSDGNRKCLGCGLGYTGNPFIHRTGCWWIREVFKLVEYVGGVCSEL